MNTILDNCYGILLEKIEYKNEGELSITLLELIKSEEKEQLEVYDDKKITDLYRVQELPRSRKLMIRFSSVTSYHVIDESLVILSSEEIQDTTGIIQSIQNSKYEQYLRVL